MKKDVVYKEFYNSGELLLERPYKNGVPHGISTQYFSNGKKLDQVEYVNGKIKLVKVLFAWDTQEPTFFVYAKEDKLLVIFKIKK
jgi:antitoxin component YwqK of YwqJK toxin-antitoxin module